MAVLVHSSVARASVEAVYAFHEDPRNLEAIQPPGFHLVQLELPESIEEGTEFELINSCFGFRQRWRVKIDSKMPPHGQPRRARIIDEVVRGPFPYFRHRHEFVEQPSGTRLTDVIDFDPPGGPVAWLVLPGAWLVLKAVFAYRHLATRWRLE
jgi:ligand-binding SRPBCC domain-containing protein